MEGHPPDCPEYCCSEFANLPDNYNPNVILNQTNTIHTILKREKFRVDGKAMTLAKYKTLIPTLKLASRMLEDDRTVEYIIDRVDGAFHKMHAKDEAPGPELSQAERDSYLNVKFHRMIYSRPRRHGLGLPPGSPPIRTPVDQAMRDRVREILTNLAIIFKEYNILPKVNNATHPLAAAVEDGGLPGLSDTAKQIFRQGRRSRIELNAEEVWEYAKAEDARRYAYALGRRYLTASTIVHELSHVLHFALDALFGKSAPFYNDCALNESGFDLENHLFGGIPLMSDLEHLSGRSIPGVWAMVRERYPCSRIWKHYKSIGQLGTLRGKLDRWSVVSRLPYQFIYSLFKDSFWETEAPSMWPEPLQPSEDYRWLIRSVNITEKYIDKDGDEAEAVINGLGVTAHTTDVSLTDENRALLSEILADKLRRQAVVPAHNPPS